LVHVVKGSNVVSWYYESSVEYDLLWFECFTPSFISKRIKKIEIRGETMLMIGKTIMNGKSYEELE